MLKFTIVLCAVFFVSRANAFILSDYLETVQQTLQQLNDAEISKFEKRFTDIIISTEKLTRHLTAVTYKRVKRVFEDILSVTQKIITENNAFEHEIEDEDIVECSELHDRVSDILNVVISTFVNCTNDKLKTGFTQIDGIDKITNNVLDKLAVLKTTNQHCADNIDHWILVPIVMACNKEVAINVSNITTEAFSQLHPKTIEIIFFMITFQETLDSCNNNTKFNNLYQKLKNSVNETEKCIQRHNDKVKMINSLNYQSSDESEIPEMMFLNYVKKRSNLSLY